MATFTHSSQLDEDSQDKWLHEGDVVIFTLHADPDRPWPSCLIEYIGTSHAEDAIGKTIEVSYNSESVWMDFCGLRVDGVRKPSSNMNETVFKLLEINKFTFIRNAIGVEPSGGDWPEIPNGRDDDDDNDDDLEYGGDRDADHDTERKRMTKIIRMLFEFIESRNDRIAFGSVVPKELRKATAEVW